MGSGIQYSNHTNYIKMLKFKQMYAKLISTRKKTLGVQSWQILTLYCDLKRFIIIKSKITIFYSKPNYQIFDSTQKCVLFPIQKIKITM